LHRPPQEQQIVPLNRDEVSAALAGVAAYAATRGAVLSPTRVMAHGKDNIRPR
jgi:hypothetical protein